MYMFVIYVTLCHVNWVYFESKIS